VTAKTRRQQIEEMLAADPHDPFLRYGLAMEHASAGDDQGAARCFQELLVARPDYVPAYLQAAQALVRLGRSDEAGAVLRRGVAAARQKGDEHAAEEMQGLLGSLG
jgi:thioredoxin-like negative regulator of GroEL